MSYFTANVTTIRTDVTVLSLVAISILRLVYLSRSLAAGQDPSFGSIPYSILTQCHGQLSVIIACTPALKPFIDHVQSGMLNVALSKHRPGTTFGQNSFNLQAWSRESNHESTASKRPRRTTASSTSKKSSLRIPSSHRSQGSDSNYEFVQNAQGRIVRRPVTAVERTPPSTISGASHSSSRPSLPPDSLRPDLAVFTTRIDNNRPQTEGSSTAGRHSEESGESAKRIIERTKTWDIRFDDYHAPSNEHGTVEIRPL